MKNQFTYYQLRAKNEFCLKSLFTAVFFSLTGNYETYSGISVSSKGPQQNCVEAPVDECLVIECLQNIDWH